MTFPLKENGNFSLYLLIKQIYYPYKTNVKEGIRSD